MRNPILYIDPPTIPEGMTVQEYRKVRSVERAWKIRGIRRIDARKMVI